MSSHFLLPTFRGKVWLSVILATIIALLYSQSIHYPLVYDDLPHLHAEGIFKEYGSEFSLLRARWLSYGSFALTYALAGEQWAVYRITNIALHCATSIAIFWFFCRLFGVVLTDVRQNAIQPCLLAFFGALIFALHPLSVYAVAYLIQRSTLMATLGSMLALACFLEGLVRQKKGWHVLASIFYVLALSSKELSVMLPAVAFSLYLLVRKPTFGQLAKAWWVWLLFAISIAALTLRYAHILGKPFDQTSLQYLQQMSQQYPDIVKQAFPLSILNQSFLFFKYLALWAIPYPGWMSVNMREAFPVSFLSWPDSVGLIAFLVYPFIALRLLRQGGSRGLFGFGMLFPWLLYFTQLVTVWIQDPFVLYRNYLWMAGLPALLPLLFSRLSSRVAISTLLIFSLVLAGLAVNRIFTFKSDLALWNDALLKIEENRFRPGLDQLYTGRGVAYANLAQAEPALHDMTRAIELNPGYAINWLNRGSLYAQLQRFPEALADSSKAIELDKQNFKAYFNRGTVHAQMGNDAAALQDFSTIIDAASAWSDVFIRRGAIFEKQQKYAEALRDYEQAVASAPANPLAYTKRGYLAISQKRVEDGFKDLDKALSLAPQSLDAHFNRGFAYLKLGRFEDALRDLDNAVAIDPLHVGSHMLRGEIHIRLRLLDKAIDEYTTTLRINPNEAGAYFNRGQVYLALKNLPAAKQDLDKACQFGRPMACEILAKLGT